MPIENPGPGEVQVRIEAVGVCGSDRHAFTEGAVGSTLDLLFAIASQYRDGVGTMVVRA